MGAHKLTQGEREKRFWARVDRSGGPDACWPWTGYIRPRDGYGELVWAHRTDKQLAHRIAWLLVFGDPGDLCVLHHCDNRPCCNPLHHFRGTRTDNANDRHAKGRSTGPHHPLQGERNPSAKLSDDAVRELRFRYEMGESNQRQLAAWYGISQRAVWYIVHRHHYPHIK